MYNATFNKLVARFEEKGYANINGRQKEYQWGGDFWIGEIESQWELSAVEYDGHHYIALKHWGTAILYYNIDSKKVEYLYSQSKTDAKYLTFMLDYLGFDHLKVGYRPVNGGAYVHNRTTGKETPFNGYILKDEYLKEVLKKNER